MAGDGRRHDDGGRRGGGQQRGDRREDRDDRGSDFHRPSSRSGSRPDDRPPRDRSRDRSRGRVTSPPSDRRTPPDRRPPDANKPPSGVRPLGGSSSVLAEAAKLELQRRQQKQQQQQQQPASSNGAGNGRQHEPEEGARSANSSSDAEDGELHPPAAAGASASEDEQHLGKRKHAPIVWHTPPKVAKTSADGDSDAAGDGDALHKVEPSTVLRPPPPTGTSSGARSAGSSGGAAGVLGQGGALPHVYARPAVSGSVHGRSDEEEEEDGSEGEAVARKAKSGISSRWLDMEEEEVGQQQQAGGNGQEAQGGDGAAEEGPAPGPTPMEGPEPSPGAGVGGGAEDVQREGTAEEEQEEEEDKEPPQPDPSMLNECRSVEVYQRLNHISEGAYGMVFRAREKGTGRICALKKVKMDKERDGFPQTSIREINILLSLRHPSIVNVSEVVVGDSLDSIYMVMEYMEHDLKALSDVMQQPFTVSEVKCLMQQLLSGVAYLHENWVLHRDLKTSNLLYSNKGELKICDFGLARQYGSPLRPYTQMVVTLWYRAPELLLGATKYSTAIDVWSCGCIMAEWLSKKVLLDGKGELEQMDKIWKLLGTPNERNWPGCRKLPNMQKLQFREQPHNRLRERFPPPSGLDFDNSKPVLSDLGFDLLSRLLTLCPERRITAKEALDHAWFRERPLPKEKVFMPTFPNTAELKAGTVGGGVRAGKRVLAASPDPRIAPL